ncbi:MAG: class I SAM-dependent methyltransferase [Candidatus Omnitrophica bacterium]|nr:class I SAM-dependent methyltransferase [Candidatus Omnitrophota bacterium]
MTTSKNPKSHEDWNQFSGKAIPGSIPLQPIFFEKVYPGHSLVDIGCGAGRICFDLLKRGYGPITGVDQNEDGIRIAREKLRDMDADHPDRCQFEKRDALQTGFEDQAFDAGVILAMLTTFTTPETRLQVLREARRIIRRGGGLYLTEFMQTWHHPLYYERYLQGEQETGVWGSFFAVDKSGSIALQAHHFTERELVDLLHEAGFAISHWEYSKVRTQTGKTINGAVIWAI